MSAEDAGGLLAAMDPAAAGAALLTLSEEEACAMLGAMDPAAAAAILDTVSASEVGQSLL